MILAKVITLMTLDITIVVAAVADISPVMMGRDRRAAQLVVKAAALVMEGVTKMRNLVLLTAILSLIGCDIPTDVESTGPQGEPGIDGIDGVDGRDGVDGIDGIDGLNGIGIDGADGIQGETGPMGEQGVPGMDGQGVQGERGEQGVAGETGATGEQGLAGLTGETGPQGLRGESGIDGVGIPGIQGERGLTGEAGVPGSDGYDGKSSRTVYHLTYPNFTSSELITPGEYIEEGILYKWYEEGSFLATHRCTEHYTPYNFLPYNDPTVNNDLPKKSCCIEDYSLVGETGQYNSNQAATCLENIPGTGRTTLYIPSAMNGMGCMPKFNYDGGDNYDGADCCPDGFSSLGYRVEFNNYETQVCLEDL